MGRPIHRRLWLQQGSAAAGAMLIRPKLSCGAEPVKSAARQVIVIFLQGGLSHLDSWDLKPAAPAEYRGDFQPIATGIPGFSICEHLPLLAQRADRYSVVRSVYHGTPSHEAAIHWTLTGYDYPGANVTTRNRNVKPSMGSIVSRILGPGHPGLPAYVCIPDRGQLGDRVRYASATYLGMAHDPLEAGMPPVTANAPFPIPPNLSLASGIDLSRMEDRLGLLKDLDDLPRSLDSQGMMAGLDEFNRQALDLLSHDATRRAFDMAQEPQAIRERYGNGSFAQRLVLARRLSEAGVRFTLVNFANNQDWDTHTANFDLLKKTRLPELDQAVSALLDDLMERGLLESTLVAMFGEFGRTPKINQNAGRDHWSNVFSVMLAGGGLKGGQCLGTSSPHGEHPLDRPVHFNDVLATIYRQQGVSTNQVFQDQFGRPFPLLDGGHPISELV